MNLIQKLLISVVTGALAFLSLTSEPAQAQGPHVEVQANGTLDGLWVCVTSVDTELQFPFEEDDCLLFQRFGVVLTRFSVHVSGSSDELTGVGTTKIAGQIADPSENNNKPVKYAWDGSVEAGLLVLDGVITRDVPEFVGTPTQLWIELDTGATQFVFHLPASDPGQKFSAILMGFSRVSTNQ
jgi:hypothetical protein